jgi:hypothetical protein
MSEPTAADPDRLNQHLSQLSTVWNDLGAAHAGPKEAAVAARRRRRCHRPNAVNGVVTAAADRDTIRRVSAAAERCQNPLAGDRVQDSAVGGGETSRTCLSRQLG